MLSKGVSHQFVRIEHALQVRQCRRADRLQLKTAPVPLIELVPIVDGSKHRVKIVRVEAIDDGRVEICILLAQIKQRTDQLAGKHLGVAL